MQKVTNVPAEVAEMMPTEKLLFDIIGVEPKSFDELQGLTKLDTESLLTTLTIMEIEGLVEKRKVTGIKEHDSTGSRKENCKI